MIHPCYVFTIFPPDIQKHIKLFLKHPITETREYRKNILLDYLQLRLNERILYLGTYDPGLHREILKDILQYINEYTKNPIKNRQVCFLLHYYRTHRCMYFRRHIAPFLLPMKYRHESFTYSYVSC